MKISIQWLSDYIDLKDIAVPQITQALTDIGLEVEAITSESTLPFDSAGIVVGEVLAASRHPNADQLQVCTVTVGSGEPLAIVCGAPNARVGIKVAVAQVGAVLPGDFKIKKSKIRGETSWGMLCSEKELGLSEEHQGILELATSAKVGASLAEILGPGDSVLDIKVTPNRSDCLSYLGIARDLAAKLNRPLREFKGIPQDVQGLSDGSLHGKDIQPLKVGIHGESVSDRFVALVVQGVEAKPSPEWLQKRLQSAGMRPINLIVDATNYVMLEFGQPSHAYDLRAIRGGQIGVKALEEPTTLATLDGVTRSLSQGDLVIVDGEGVLGLAGVMGGAASEVRADTTAIVIEVAAFSRTMVRKTSKRLGLQSEASYRFERGTDLNRLVQVALRVAALIKGVPPSQDQFQSQVVKNLGLGPITDFYPGKGSPRVIALRLSFLRQMLPQTPPLSRETVIGILGRLDLKFLDGNEDRLVFQVPTARHDLEREVDLVEEVARIHGYDKVGDQIPTMVIKPTIENPIIEFLEDLRTVTAQRGLVEVVSFPFTSEDDYRSLGLGPDHLFWPQVALQNPMSERFGFLPTTLVPCLLRAAQNNRARGDFGGRIFEVGRGFFGSSKDFAQKKGFDSWKSLTSPSSHISHKAREEMSRPQERLWLTGVLDQPKVQKKWDGPQQAVDFFMGKRLISEILGAFGMKDLNWSAPKGDDVPWLHPGRSAWVLVGQTPVGFVGELHPDAAVRWQWESEAPIVFELMVDGLYKKLQKQRSQGISLQHQFSKYPGISRDLALLCEVSLTHGEVEAALESFKAKRFLESWELFDCYQGPHVPQGKKSLGYRLNFRSPDKTLTDPEIEAEASQVLTWLTESLGVTQR